MNTIEFLKQYERAAEREQLLQDEYDQEALMIDAVRSLSDNDGMPHGSGVSRKTEDLAIKLGEAAQRYLNAEQEAFDVKERVYSIIADIDGTEGEILYERYINLRRWEDICVLVHLSWRQTHRLHRKGLQMVEKRALNGTQ